MAKLTFGFSKLLVESIAIFLSVFLAFAADQWREDYNERERADDTLALVRVELEQNLVELEKTIPSREVMVAEYAKALDDLAKIGTFPAQLTPITPPEITSIAYEIATDSGAVTIVDPQDLVLIAKAYKALGEVQRNRAFLSERNAQTRYRDGEQFLSGRLFYASTAKEVEPEAAIRIKAALQAL